LPKTQDLTTDAAGSSDLELTQLCALGLFVYLVRQAAVTLFSITLETHVLRLLPRVFASMAARACSSGARRKQNCPEYGLLGSFPSFLQVAR
jgi:hypothetical protein